MKYTKILAPVMLVLMLAITLPLAAQSDRGAINGTVVDPTGAAVTGAQVTAVNQSTGETRKTTTNNEGRFLFPEMKAAPWKVTVEAAGFKTIQSEVVQVPVAITRTVDVTLPVGAQGTTVEVTGEAAAIQTDTPTLSTNVTERQVKEMPLLVSAEIGGRTPLAFIFLDSNVAAADTNNQSNATAFRVNGGQALGAEILIDGANTRRAQNGSYFTEVAPGPQAYQEFTYNTTQYSAEFGNSSAGVVNFTLKSGGNRLHGEVYEFLKNEALNANYWTSNNNDVPRAPDKEHDYGFNLGGPVYIPKLYDGRNKTFFFFNFGGYRFKESQNTYVTVPTVKMKTGDFSELLTDPYVLQYAGGPVAVYDPHQDPALRTAIPNNRMDQYVSPVTGQPVLDPVGMAIMSYFPNPTREGVYNNYLAESSAPINMDSYVAKVDQIITDKQRLSGSYTYRKQTAIKGGFPKFPSPAIAAGVWDQDFKSHFARLQHDYTISNTMLNHLNLGWNRVFVANSNSTYGFDTLSLGLPPDATANLTFPMIEFPGYNAAVDPQGVQGIGSTWWHDNMGDNMVEIGDALTWVKGKHTLKFGGNFRIQQLNVFQNFDNGGHFNFRGDQTAGPGGIGGWSLASLATGATEWSFITITDVKPAWRYFTHSYFVNDDFKVTQKLTVNLGFRWELQTPRTEAHDFYRAFDPTAMNPIVNRLGALAGAGGQGGVQAQHRGLIETDMTDISPRIGFAYQLFPKTVIRGGFGLYYAPFLYDASSGILGYRANRTITPPYELAQGNLRTNAFLSSYPAHPLTDPNGQFIGNDVDWYQTDAKAGRTNQWSVDLQRELPAGFVGTIGYIGNRATRLRSNFSRLNAVPLDYMKLGWPILSKGINDLTVADRDYAASLGLDLPANGDAVFTGFNGTVAQAVKPFPQYNRINSKLESNGQSWYNALNAKIDKRFSQGLQFTAAYTWSKLLTTAGDNLWGDTPITGVLQNPFDTGSLRTLSPSNPAHVFVFSYIYELPFGKGRSFASNNNIVDKIIGGWQISGIHRYQSGLPVTVSINNGDYNGFLDRLGYYGNLRPNLTGEQVLLGEGLTGFSTPLLNPDAFAPPPRFNAPPTADPTDPAYAAYYADPTAFFGTAPAVLNATVLPYYTENFSLLKKTRIRESVTAEFGAEFFNLFNRHRYWMPDTNLDTWDTDHWRNGNFGKSTVIDNSTYIPRRIQLRARVTF